MSTRFGGAVMYRWMQHVPCPFRMLVAPGARGRADASLTRLDGQAFAGGRMLAAMSFAADEQRNKEIVRRVYEASFAGDANAFTGAMHEDFEESVPPVLP